MQEIIQEYTKAVENFIALSQQETKLRVEIQQARARLQKAKELMWNEEQDLLGNMTKTN